MLKQSELFKKLIKSGLSAHQYGILYRLSLNETLTAEVKELIVQMVPNKYITQDCKLSEDGEKILKAIDELFKPIKKLKSMDVLGDDSDSNIEEYLDIFPSGKLPSGKYARGNKKNIVENFMWFFQEYQYSWETILDATVMYVEEFRKKGYLYMRTAQYFIKKLKDGTVESELANYCDLIDKGIEEEKPTTFKQNVV